MNAPDPFALGGYSADPDRDPLEGLGPSEEGEARVRAAIERLADTILRVIPGYRVANSNLR